MLNNRLFCLPNRKHILIGMFVCTILTIAGCTASMQTYKLYPGPALASSEVATIELAVGTAIVVNGLNVSSEDYDVATVIPGRHSVAGGFLYSIISSEKLETPANNFPGCRNVSTEVLLQAGHTYQVHRISTGLKMVDLETGHSVWNCGGS